MNIESIFLSKIDLFMKKHIINKFDPSEIYWWFSMSGGKDSFSMCYGIYKWYYLNGFKFNGSAFTIKQWNNNVFNSLHKQIDWIELIEIDAIEETRYTTQYKRGNQAPCVLCSKVRKIVGDRYIDLNKKTNKVNVIARGLHLSDTAVSYLWRWAFYDNFEHSIVKKYQPITQILNDIFLVKPLCYTREIESQEYAKQLNFRATCCGCPACKYPSRRDIVEESLLELYKDLKLDQWEFYVPGMMNYLQYHLSEKPDYLKKISVSGFANKKNHIDEEFYNFAIQFFKNKIDFDSISTRFDISQTLDDFAKKNILFGKKQSITNKIPLPKFFSNDYCISDSERKMIATMGPFWGSIGASEFDRKKILEIQKNILGYSINEKWTQVNEMLNEFYKRGNDNDNEKKSGLDNYFICCNCNN